MHLNKFTKQQVLNKAKKVHRAYGDAVGRGDTPTGERLMNFHNRLMKRASNMQHKADKKQRITKPQNIINIPEADDFFSGVKPGHRVHYLTPQGQSRSGRVVMNQGTHLVLNRGDGQPQVVNQNNFIKSVDPKGKVRSALLSNVAKAMKDTGGKLKEAMRLPQGDTDPTIKDRFGNSTHETLVSRANAKRANRGRKFGWEQQKRVALRTLELSKIGANVMGGMTHDQARHFLDSNGIKYDKKLVESNAGYHDTDEAPVKIGVRRDYVHKYIARLRLHNADTVVGLSGRPRPKLGAGERTKLAKKDAYEFVKNKHGQEAHDKLKKWHDDNASGLNDHLHQKESTTDDHYGPGASNMNKAVAALHKKLRKKYDENEDENRHSENAVLLAKHFGTPEELERMQHMVKIRDKIGHLHSDHTGWSAEMSQKYYHKLKESVNESSKDVEASAQRISIIARQKLLKNKYNPKKKKKKAKKVVKESTGNNLPPVHEIARGIKKNWKKMYFGAVPYIDAMHSMRSAHDDYGMDTGHSVIAYGLSNMNSYSGKSVHDPELAKVHRAQLKAHLKAPKPVDEAREGEYRANMLMGKGGVDLRKKMKEPEKAQQLKAANLAAIHRAMLKARQTGVDEARMDNVTAREILDKHKARDADFHALTRDQVSGLLDSAKEVGYRTPSWASGGSKGRMFHAHLQRVAKRQHQLKLGLKEAKKAISWNPPEVQAKYAKEKKEQKMFDRARREINRLKKRNEEVKLYNIEEASKAKVKKTAERAIKLAKDKKKSNVNTKPELIPTIGNATSSTLEGNHSETGDGVANHA